MSERENIISIDFPPIGSIWEHRNGARYRVEMITNTEPDRQDEYPTTVVYRNIGTGNLYSRPLVRWHLSMTRIDAADMGYDSLIRMREAVNWLAEEIHARNVLAGWWTDLRTGEDLHGKRNVGELLALIHSEISEAAEAQHLDAFTLFNIQEALDEAWQSETYKKETLLKLHESISRALDGHRKSKMDDKLTNRPQFRVELIDAMIRILDTLGSDNEEHPAGDVFMEKVEYNGNRADHKPENRIKAGGKSY